MSRSALGYPDELVLNVVRNANRLVCPAAQLATILSGDPASILGKPEEVSALVAYLCSEDAGYVTGSNIAINGGQHMQ
jgi:NAD(P)-dependent dehydrogenase (short-subunit alcohol dehydrogenase family)